MQSRLNQLNTTVPCGDKFQSFLSTSPGRSEPGTGLSPILAGGRLANPVLSYLGRLFFRAPIGDFHCGLRGFRRHSMMTLGLEASGMEFASEMVVRATLAGQRAERSRPRWPLTAGAVPANTAEGVLLSDRATASADDPEDHRGAAATLFARLSTGTLCLLSGSSFAPPAGLAYPHSLPGADGEGGYCPSPRIYSAAASSASAGHGGGAGARCTVPLINRSRFSPPCRPAFDRLRR